jgi:hypothetical protein
MACPMLLNRFVGILFARCAQRPGFRRGICRNGIPSAIALERGTCVGIDDGAAGGIIAKRVIREIAGAHGQRRHEACKGNALALNFCSPSTKKKVLSFDNGAPDGAAELVQVELRGRLGKVVPGIQVGVAHKLEERTVKSCWCRTLC